MSYRDLASHYRRISHLTHVAAITGWDEAVMMPTGGGDARADALATLDGLIHELSTDPRIEGWIAAAKEATLSPSERANVRECERRFTRATVLPQKLVEAQRRAQVRCEQAWRTQRGKSDFQGHLPLLEEVVQRKREEADILSARLGMPPYQALIDAYEPGMSTARLDLLFADLEQQIPPLLGAVLERQAKAPPHPPQGPFPVDAQRALGLSLMKAVGFDFDHGRLDTSHHPFCGGVPEDVRITTRYDERDFTTSLMGVLHETGHAKYEQGLPSDLRGLPVGEARSMGVHESQSLLMEMQVSRGLPFLTFVEPLVRHAFADNARAQPEAFTADNLERWCGKVERSFIRVDADEVTYPLHVILRYGIERDLVEGRLRTAELPERWDFDMRRLLDLSTGDLHRDGCMQDVHWSGGSIGYFPSYTLGALLAAQIFEAARIDLKDLDTQVAQGKFAPLNAFLRERVWSKASILETEELVREATGRPLGTEAFLAHLRRRYLGAR